MLAAGDLQPRPRGCAGDRRGKAVEKATTREEIGFRVSTVQFSSLQSLSRVRLFATPWTAARQASLSITNSRSLLKLMEYCQPFLYPAEQGVASHRALLLISPTLPWRPALRWRLRRHVSAAPSSQSLSTPWSAHPCPHQAIQH